MTLRLLKIIVQPVFVEDDGEHLTERIAEPFAVTPADWPARAVDAITGTLEQDAGERG